MKFRSAIAALALSSLSSACSYDAFIPETADGAGDEAVRVGLTLSTTGSLQGDVDAVSVEVVDILLHNIENDSWIIMSESTTDVELSHRSAEQDLQSIPVAVGEYDRALILFDHARVASANDWNNAELAIDSIEVNWSMDVAEDRRIRVEFDLSSGLVGGPSAWQLTPTVFMSEMPMPTDEG